MSEIVRIDRYTVTVDGFRVRMTENQEAAVRAMDDAALARFLRVMGAPPAEAAQEVER